MPRRAPAIPANTVDEQVGSTWPWVTRAAVATKIAGGAGRAAPMPVVNGTLARIGARRIVVGPRQVAWH
jgi:hypothetical protein